jgi:hypothetical protein
MSNVGRVLSLTPVEQRRLAQAFLIVAGVRIGLSLVPFPRFQALLARLRAQANVKSGSGPTAEQLARDVRIVSSYVPRATCLTQALAGQAFLAHYGYPAVVHIGVTTSEGDAKAFQSHAWLESDGSVIIGEPEQPYVPLVTF